MDTHSSGVAEIFADVEIGCCYSALSSIFTCSVLEFLFTRPPSHLLYMSAPFGDYHLASYSILCDRAEIRLRAERCTDGDPQATEIIFAGVAAYHFKHDNFETILGHVIERPLEPFLEEHASKFSQGASQSGWAPFWTGSVSTTLAKLQAESIHAFEITSSFGLRGWVLAVSFDSQLADPHAAYSALS